MAGSVRVYGSSCWTHPRFSGVRLRLACEALHADGGPWSGPLGPFLTLLRSGDQAAVGIALDTYQQADADSRFGENRCTASTVPRSSRPLANSSGSRPRPRT
ncbi:hypothetical protein ACFQU9_07925 [Actinomadura namibiensis]|uniref:hypothetical protein n=1 Tax=Actinomadura kijaniata TaxID=46161 RepID=UPI0036192947